MELTPSFSSFFFNDTPTTESYTLSLHDALPISNEARVDARCSRRRCGRDDGGRVCRSGPKFRRHLCTFTNREIRSEEHTSELQSHSDLVCRLLLEKKNNTHGRDGLRVTYRADAT